MCCVGCQPWWRITTSAAVPNVDTMIETRGLTRRFGERTVVDDQVGTLGSSPLFAALDGEAQDALRQGMDVVKLAKAAISEGEVFDCKKLVKDPKLCEESR